jgi:SAM-dependent methyltransferase
MSRPLYDRIGSGYAALRRPDPRIAARIDAGLGAAGSVLNVGAGTGSYEPPGRRVVAVEPSAEMVRQRGAGAAPAVRAVAESLPFISGSFDAALAVLTLHHWGDWRTGLRELRRVARRVVLLTCDPDHAAFWLVRDYFPEILRHDREIFPPLAAVASELGTLRIEPLPVPWDCSDGFLGAYWRRPERYLDAAARGAISTFSRVDAAAGLQRLRGDLADGSWQRRNADLLAMNDLDIGYRLCIAE